MASSKATRTNVFISYSHADKKWLERLKRHLKPLVREGCLDCWDDTHIRPGDDWQQEIRTALDKAQAAVLLISADFFASNFIDETELPPLLAAAQEKGVRVLPLILSASRFARDPSLARFHAVNSPDRPLNEMPEGEQEEVLDRLAQSIDSALAPHSQLFEKYIVGTLGEAPQKAQVLESAANAQETAQQSAEPKTKTAGHLRDIPDLAVPVGIENFSFSTQYKRLLRNFLLVLPVIAAFCLLYGYMDSTIGMHRDVNSIWIPIAIGFCMMHIIYLLFVFERTLLLAPITSFDIPDAFIPIALFFAYFLFAASVFFTSTAAYSVSLSFFVVVYILWIQRDLKEKRRLAAIDARREYIELFWVFVDGLMLILICVALTIKLIHWLHQPADFYTDIFPIALTECCDVSAVFSAHIKDVAVSICVLVYFFTRMDILPQKIDYVQRWQDYLAHTCVRRVRPLNKNGEIWNEVSQKLAAFGDTCTVMDMGCGNGKRFCELYEHVLRRSCPQQTVRLLGVDTAPDWETPFFQTIRRVDLTRPEFFTVVGKALKTQAPDCVYLSHVLYLPRSTKDMVKVVKSLKPGTLVFVRGISANSWFYQVSIVWSARRFGPFPQHSWVTDGLKLLVESCDLRPLVIRKPLQADWVIVQDFEMARERDARSLGRVVEQVFDHNCQSFVEDVCYALFRQGITRIQNWDLLYVYERA